ncbi:ATP-binding cassette domain-containing protein [Actinomadura sp. WAC 06369]|uniref:ATP-binding cassette domain-containing protein n=1 Tax=Actinomadura sp. WAC 06369 TaxID=2203193 RepID=UPI000F7AD346|nr:ATP-binding cassette domain-containing protein [Actinomadura sp. WAC 06369]RSN44447.1 daunorubicin/doxorubicin resistance ABC transporter ATP-binding protein DrrA [Actinomadura sp. WAC 06369]
MEDAIRAEGLVKRFGKTVALDGVGLSARRGTVLGLLGPNGAGKTTAVRILATLLRPDAGTARVGGLDVVRDGARVRRAIGLTGQYASVDEDLTAAENLVLIGRLLDLRKGDARARAAELLERFELADDAGRRVSAFSGGMRRRLDLAACMVGRPAVTFLDEPTTGLDPGRREDVWRMIRAMTADGGTVLLTTQYLEEADALADGIVVIDRGRVIAEGTPAELKRVAGGQAITVRPRDPGRLVEVAAILNAVSGRAAESPRRDVLTVPVDGEDALAETVRRLDAAGIAVAELSLRLPSLDEVFFTLTGHGVLKEEAAV